MITCNHCGHANPPGKKFCSQCGTSLGSAAPQTSVVSGGSDTGGRPPTAEAPLVAKSSPAPTPTARGLSIWWLIVPTLVYAFLVRNILSTLLLAAIGAGLRYAQTRKEVPPAARPYLPLLQPVVVFFFLGAIRSSSSGCWRRWSRRHCSIAG
jgi:hypothetical protein